MSTWHQRPCTQTRKAPWRWSVSVFLSVTPSRKASIHVALGSFILPDVKAPWAPSFTSSSKRCCTHRVHARLECYSWPHWIHSFWWMDTQFCLTHMDEGIKKDVWSLMQLGSWGHEFHKITRSGWEHQTIGTQGPNLEMCSNVPGSFVYRSHPETLDRDSSTVQFFLYLSFGHSLIHSRHNEFRRKILSSFPRLSVV